MKNILFLLAVFPVMIFSEYHHDDMPVPHNLDAGIPVTTSHDYEQILEQEAYDHQDTEYEIEDMYYDPEFTESQEVQEAVCVLNELSIADQTAVKKAVIDFRFAKQKVELQMRPALNNAVLLRDEAKLTLTELLAEEKNTPEYVAEVRFQINRVKEAEQRILNVRKSTDQNVDALKSNLKTKIARIINRWLIKSVTLTETDVMFFLKEAEKRYGSEYFVH